MGDNHSVAAADNEARTTNPPVETAGGRFRVLSQLSEPFTLVLPADLQQRAEVLPVPRGSPLRPELCGDVLLGTWGNPQIYELAERVPWLHYSGTGLDGLDVRRLAPRPRSHELARRCGHSDRGVGAHYAAAPREAHERGAAARAARALAVHSRRPTSMPSDTES